MAYCKLRLGLTNKMAEKIHTVKNDYASLDKKIINLAGDFAYEHGAWMPYDYFCDEGDPSYYDKDAVYVCIEFIDSDVMDEDDFYIMWDNYMKALGRNRL